MILLAPKLPEPLSKFIKKIFSFSSTFTPSIIASRKQLLNYFRSTRLAKNAHYSLESSHLWACDIRNSSRNLRIPPRATEPIIHPIIEKFSSINNKLCRRNRVGKAGNEQILSHTKRVHLQCISLCSCKLLRTTNVICKVLPIKYVSTNFQPVSSQARAIIN